MPNFYVAKLKSKRRMINIKFRTAALWGKQQQQG